MNVNKTYLMIAVLCAGLIVFYGCKKSEPPAPAPTSSGTMEGHDHAAMTTEAAKETTATAEQTATATTAEQTTCPVMGGAIDKSIFIEYKGKKVYFCCPGCEEQFKKEPEKYIAKLPQFQQ